MRARCGCRRRGCRSFVAGRVQCQPEQWSIPNAIRREGCEIRAKKRVCHSSVSETADLWAGIRSHNLFSPYLSPPSFFSFAHSQLLSLLPSNGAVDIRVTSSVFRLKVRS